MRNLKYYSYKEISQSLNITLLEAKQVKKIINADNGYLLLNYKSVEKWVTECYNSPNLTELRLCALNELLECYGTEAITGPEYIDNYCMYINAVYINAGDAYLMTVLFDYRTNKFVLTSFGDYVEKYIKE